MIKESLECCHRVMILLTFEFIQDDWSLFSLQEVTKFMIKIIANYKKDLRS